MSFWSGLIVTLNSQEDKVELGNQTYNHGRIWGESMGVDHFRKFKNEKAKELILPLKLGLARIDCDPEYYAKFEPANGWGSVEQAVEYMRKVLQACIEHPELYYRFNG